MIAVVGAGLMGAATAWQLARRGHEVTLVEAHDIGHRHGSSHGSSRIFRRAYADPLYVGLTGRAYEEWRELEGDSATPLLRTTGGLDLGEGRDPEALAGVLEGAGVPYELLGAEAALERWPFIRFDGAVLYHPGAGVVDADATVAACVRRAGELGAQVLTGVRVVGIKDGRVGLADGREVVAETVVVAAGAWLPDLGLSVVLPELRVTQQQVFHFRQRQPADEWPVLVAKDADMQVYGLPSGSDGGAGPAMKVAEHDRGTPTTAGTRTGIVDSGSRTRITTLVEDRFPGLDPDPVAEATCLYTTTPDEDFVLDRQGSLVIVSPCSGHGAKFTPLIGAMAADLATGKGVPHPRFRLGR
ncbi:FAD-dependent oxidoreductase [Streptomyces acidiscabies]|uniref:FAD-dependent oxidoreductase n=1 Tax=Streptomyces acidiscabies TaxID=42234 RepID=A0AAP6EHQ8_9ACTN|nr:FAD-dependent oxidoreductase [Streptomyces acidiscabies]MBP5934642.1 FAD-dependent oxidoreductase [Streptomyces sp. LBUM 1476]MBZ3917638.1 FAD-dependent oxidoreductase [Streptomyces acidiscabies]MDX2962675.1 FAD-dependent oxidoreductase [Streptomyces acidiscabies]MDX3019018.1 FAD-dependent oxidoreductase [Streptomyces acidiscabies]MDX3790310.1 FAD-dependent oxidoreductase [Streptomyces acidiscabies]